MYIYCNKIIPWDEKKNDILKKRRGISFEAILESLAGRGPLWTREHPRRDKYPGQRQLSVLIAGYVFIVPYEETHEEIIFKTAYPSRRATRAQRRIGKEGQGQGPS